jgi:hypothetical protein
MPISLEEIKIKPVKLPPIFFTDSRDPKDALNVVYNEMAYSPEFEREMKADQTSAVLATMVNAMVLEWDLLERPQTPEEKADPELMKKVPRVPINQGRLEGLPTAFLTKVITEITGHQVPKAPSPAASESSW